MGDGYVRQINRRSGLWCGLHLVDVLLRSLFSDERLCKHVEEMKLLKRPIKRRKNNKIE